MSEEEKRDQLRAFGLTHGETEEMRLNQIHGDVKMIPANNSKAGDFQDIWFERDYKDYQIPEHDKMHYHVAIEARLFNDRTGERRSRPQVQCIDVPTFNMLKNMKPHDGFAGKNVHILHNPALDKDQVDLGRFKTLKQAKDHYETMSGKRANQFWDMKRTLKEIGYEEEEQRLAKDETARKLKETQLAQEEEALRRQKETEQQKADEQTGGNQSDESGNQ